MMDGLAAWMAGTQAFENLVAGVIGRRSWGDRNGVTGTVELAYSLGSVGQRRFLYVPELM